MPPQTTASVSKATRAQLNAGTAASRTLVELLVIDFSTLLGNVAHVPAEAIAQVHAAEGRKTTSEAIDAMRETLVQARAPVPRAWKPGSKLGITQRMALAGALLAKHDARLVEQHAMHASDTVRGWAAYAMMRGGAAPRALSGKLKAIRAFAADEHSGVREWAWLAVRPFIEDEAERAIELLTPWTTSADANVRRFASEATRPRGVWCNHITLLKQRPALAMPILQPLRADASRYVQNSVANWLNDASKSDAAFVRAVAKQWGTRDASPHTLYIVKRAMRTLRAKA
ncbi:MAG TPA: DNA alkylation repair protein [Phycisphaerales bacterium]|nr:DNA alkylation repair protein [Phycisphaerales bacterium]